MARNKGIFPFAANFEVKAASPLDPRVLVENKSELISKDTWPLDGDTLYIYKGLLVSVQEERAIYMLVDPDKILETDYSGWERKDGSSPGAVSYEDIYIIEGLTAQDIYMFEGGILNIDGRDLSEAINSNKRVYIKYSNNAGKAGIIPCSAYKEDVYYVSFRLGSSLYGFDIGADSQYIDETSMFHIDIQEKLESGENIKRINGQSILGRGEITIEGLPSAIPDWNENDPSAASYIKNRTHYEVEHEITNGFTLVGFLYNKCKYDEDTDGYYTTSDIKIRYNEDDYEGTIIIQKGTLLGYDNFNDEVTITGEDQGEEFEFTSYIEDYNIYLKVSNPLGGTNFRLLEYTTLDDAYIPDTIARKSDLENIGGGGSADSGEITEIKTTLDSHNELIEDLQNMKIDKENDDYYPNMSVGVADNLSGVDVVASEFTSRQSGGGAILDGTARIEAIKGNSIIWNQLTKYPEFGPADGWYKSGGPDASSVTITIIEPHDTKVEWEVQVKAPQGFSSGGSFFITPNIPLKNGHKYFYSFDIKKNTTVNTGVYFGNVWANFGDVIADSWHTFHYFVEPTDNFDRVLYLYPFNGLGSTAAEQELIALIKNLVTYDLTQMFGAGNEPTTVEEFYARMPIEINTSLYNKGQMINLNPSGIKSYSANEEPIERFQDLSLIGTLFPDGMKSVGEFHDEIRYNKETQKWEKITRIGEVDLGSLNWGYSGSLGYFYSSPSEDIGDGNTFKETNKQVVLINSADFTGLHWSAFTDNYVSPRNNAISLFYTPDWDAVRANILCNEYTDAASFKEYLQGKKAYFVLNDPIVEEIDFDGNLDYQVWNGGTEELVADNPTAPLRADIAYGFNAVGKIKELEEKINSGGGGGVSKEYVDTKVTELSAEVGKKQDTITDLETIRSGAAKGATALQSIPDEYATKTYVDNAIKEIPQGGGEPSQYIKDATTSADGNTLTLTKKDNTQVVFSPSGGSTPSGGNDEMQRMIAGASANFIWEDVDGKIHCEVGEFKTRFGQNNPSFSTSVKKIIACSFDSTTSAWAYFFGTGTSSIEEIYPYAFTSPKLTDISLAFAGMVKVKDLSFAKYIDTSECTILRGVFGHATADEVDVSRWNTSKVTTLGTTLSFFGTIKNIIGLENWDTSLVTNMQSMFNQCVSKLDGITEWDVSSCDNFLGIFEACNTEKVDLSKWQIKSTASISRMCILSKIKEFGLPNIPQGLDTDTAFSYMKQLVDIFMQDESMIHASLNFQHSQLLNAMSVKVILSHLADTHDEGATITFNNTLYAKYSAEDRAEIDALRDAATSNGWIIVNMG